MMQYDLFQAFFTKFASSYESLVCRKDLSCRVIKRRKQAYCNYCRLQKCLQAGLTQDGVILPPGTATSSSSSTVRPQSTPSSEKPQSKKRKRTKTESQSDSNGPSGPYQEAAAQFQSFMPDIVKSGLTLDDDNLITIVPQNQLEPVGLNQVQFNAISSIHLPKSLVIGPDTGTDTGGDDDLQSITFNQGGILKDSDISICFDDESETDKT